MAEGGQAMQPQAATTVTVTQTQAAEEAPTSPTCFRLTLQKPKSDKKVGWKAGTVDNEFMNKKKSKCCCIYEKPRAFDESESEDSGDECRHCRGHGPKDFRFDKKAKGQNGGGPGGSSQGPGSGPSHESEPQKT